MQIAHRVPLPGELQMPKLNSKHKLSLNNCQSHTEQSFQCLEERSRELSGRSCSRYRPSHSGSIREQKPETAPYLQIQSVPVAERLNPRKNTYVLVILPHGIRAAAGQYTAEEAHAIANAVKGWDWTLDPDGRPYCLARLEALLDSICKRSALKGGEES